MARSQIARKSVGESEVTFAFGDGETVVADIHALPADIVTRLALHGLSQKMGDSYASANEKGWTFAECREQASAVYANLIAGIWAAKGGGSGMTILAEALARIAGKSEAEASAVLAEMSDEQRKALEKRPDVKAVVLEIKAERAAARVTEAEVDGSDLADLF